MTFYELIIICFFCFFQSIFGVGLLLFGTPTFLMFGYSYFEDRESHLTYSVVLGKGILDFFSVYIEPYGEINNANTHTSNINMGFTYLYKKNIQFDYSFGSGLNHKLNFLSAGCSIYLR